MYIHVCILHCNILKTCYMYAYIVHCAISTHTISIVFSIHSLKLHLLNDNDKNYYVCISICTNHCMASCPVHKYIFNSKLGELHAKQQAIALTQYFIQWSKLHLATIFTNTTKTEWRFQCLAITSPCMHACSSCQ